MNGRIWLLAINNISLKSCNRFNFTSLDVVLTYIFYCLFNLQVNFKLVSLKNHVQSFRVFHSKTDSNKWTNTISVTQNWKIQRLFLTYRFIDINEKQWQSDTKYKWLMRCFVLQSLMNIKPDTNLDSLLPFNQFW